MAKVFFASDYQEGAHPAILSRLASTNLTKHPGYGTDSICASARARIRSACACPSADVHFLVGGTQTNATVIGALLASYQGVVAAETGHIATHEAGAIEAGGHKVLALPQRQGKIDAQGIRDYCDTFYNDENRDHMVAPGMVYVSQPTEYGTLYSLAELTAIHDVCKEYGLPLYVDGARLAYALASEQNDVTLVDLARLCDVFYIGGTKCGALLGEAVVVPDPSLLPHFFTIVKQQGALLAKGWLLGIQFDELFADDLYLQIGKPAIDAANTIRAALKRLGCQTVYDSPTNQIFVVLPNSTIEHLTQTLEFSFWEKYDNEHSVVRFAASWATTKDQTELLLAELSRCLQG